MTRVRLVAWREEEGQERADSLRDQGYAVEFEAAEGGALLKALKAKPPEAVVIDLSRSPALGRDLGVALRIHRATRQVPLVFLAGAPEKVEQVRRVLPDAHFAEPADMSEVLGQALAGPLSDPVVPESALAGYSGTPLPKKLGIKESMRVLLVGAPAGFRDTLGTMPAGVRLRKRFGPEVDLILWFVRSHAELRGGIDKWADRVGRGGLWIVWPKKGSEIESDLKQSLVRKTGLAAGLVDYKIAAFDKTWSGLKFAVRKNR
jgi:CheY-like chemotaxis protein